MNFQALLSTQFRSPHSVGSRFFLSAQRRQVIPAWRKPKTEFSHGRLKRSPSFKSISLLTISALASNINFQHKWTINLTVINKVGGRCDFLRLFRFTRVTELSEWERKMERGREMSY